MVLRSLNLLRSFQTATCFQRYPLKISDSARWLQTCVLPTRSAKIPIGVTRRKTESRRTFAAAPLDQIESLYQNCTTFLEQEQSLDSTKTTREITRMIEEWTKLWGKESNSNSIKSRNYYGNEKEEKLLRNGVQIVDRLAHLLLDARDANIGNTRDRTQYVTSVNLALSFWAKSPPSKLNGQRAQRLMDRMEGADLLPENSERRWKELRQISYGAVIQAHCISIDDANEKVDGATKALQLLNKMEAKNIKPPLRIYNSCIHGFAVRGMIDESERLLERLEELSEVNEGLRPDVLTCSTVLNAYLKYKGRVQGKPLEKRAEDLLDRMMRRYEATGDVQYRPNQYTFGTVISMFGKSMAASGAEDSDRILQLLIGLYEKEKQLDEKMDEEDVEKFSLQPGVGHFVSVLLAYQKRRMNSPSAVQRIEELLVQMDRIHQAGNDLVRPNYQCFVIYIDALAKAGLPEKAEQVLSRIEGLFSEEKSFDLNNYGYNLVVDAWARSRNPGREMKARAVIDRMVKLAAETGNKTLLPDKLTYTCLINAIIADRQKGFEDRCAEILSMMVTGNDRIKADQIAYNSVVKAYSLARKPEKAEMTFRRMEDAGISPNFWCYNNVLNAYAKSQSKDSAQKTIEILEKMEASGIEPPPISYAICIDALGRSEDTIRVRRAEELVERSIRKSKSSKHQSQETVVPIFNALQSVYIRSDEPNKVQKTLGVIKLMEENGLTPDIVSYNSVLSACSRLPPNIDEKLRRNAIEIAAKVVEFLRSDASLSPDSQSYNSLLWVCNDISDEIEKRQTIQAVFQMCCKDGLLSRHFLGTLKQVAGHQFFQLVGRERGHVDISELDPSWSRNANSGQVSRNKYKK